tara:strand:+ start:2488 stop:4104 length:1617 start_codon:yes stop_codon:yes gene_type:complete
MAVVIITTVMSDTTPEVPCPSGGIELLLELSLGLNASLSAADRYEGLVEAIRRALPCDAAVLFRVEGEVLVPLASHGLTEAARAQRFALAEHPRLEVICRAAGPTIFPPESELPDPFDGLLADDLLGADCVHACFGCPIRIEGELVGALSADARSPGSFDHLDARFLETLGALAGATLRTAGLIEALEREAQRSGQVARDLMREVRQRGGELIGNAPPMRRLREEIDLVGPAERCVLVTGETGTGKELVARALHEASPRREEPLIYVNCAALPESVAESELFGHLKGSFTGANADRPGKFEVAHGGTLFLDEIGELSLRVQALLLRVLQEGEIQRVGADRPHHVDVRVVAATNRDLEHEVTTGRFRADLFHRLAVYRVRVPALRDRRSDVPLLAGFFADRERRRLGLGRVQLSHVLQERLREAPWPGNVRELENLVSRALLRAAARATPGGSVLVTPRDLDLEPGSGPAASPAPEAEVLVGTSLAEGVEAYKRAAVEAALARHGGSWAAAARELGMHRSNLYHLGKRLGLAPGAERSG